MDFLIQPSLYNITRLIPSQLSYFTCLSLSHLPFSLFHSFNQESSYLPLQDYTMFQPRMSTSSHISPRRRGIIPEIDFVQWIIHPAWMGKRSGHVRREETWPIDRRFIRSIRRRCDLDDGARVHRGFIPSPFERTSKNASISDLQHLEGTNRDRSTRVQRSRNNARRGGEGCLCLPGNVHRFERSIKRGTNGEREPANELEGRSGAVENAAENGGEGERES